MKSGVHVTIDRMPQVMRGIKRMSMERVLVGAPGETAERNVPGEHGPMNNPTLLYIHENGSPAANIPARRTLGPGIADARDKIATRFGAVGRAILDGRNPDVGKQLYAVGLIAQASVRARFGGDDLAPLSASTIAARRRKGFKGSAPLIRSGDLRTAINFVVVQSTGERTVGPT